MNITILCYYSFLLSELLFIYIFRYKKVPDAKKVIGTEEKNNEKTSENAVAFSEV